MVALNGSIESAGAMTDDRNPEIEVLPKATRRRFPAEYKARILAEYERLPDGDKGAPLRREGLYSSLISEWRRQAAGGVAEGLAKKRGRPGPDAKDRRIAELEAELERLRRKVETSEKVIEVQRKVRALGTSLRERGHAVEVEAVIGSAAIELEAHVPTARACELLSRSRATHYRRRLQRPSGTLRRRATTATRAARDRLHQPTPGGHRHPLISERTCLTGVDRAPGAARHDGSPTALLR